MQISGPTVQTLPTNSDGCAFFAFLPAGTYAVSLNTPGFVDRQSVAVPTQTAGVTVGNVSSVQFDYDQAASLTLTFTADAGGSIPNNLPITLGNTQFVPTGTKRFFGTGMTRTLGSLFPAAGGYTAWAGSCADADPEGQNANTGGPYWPGAQRPDALDAAGKLDRRHGHGEDRIDHRLQDRAAAAGGATVVATHAADQLCGSGATYTLGTTDAAGFINAALPFGTWRISVTGKSPQSAWPSLVLDPNDHPDRPRSTRCDCLRLGACRDEHDAMNARFFACSS